MYGSIKEKSRKRSSKEKGRTGQKNWYVSRAKVIEKKAGNKLPGVGGEGEEGGGEGETFEFARVLYN